MPKLVGAVLALLCTATVGCGGGGDSLSKADFLEQGDAICAELTEQTDALDTPTTEDEVAAYLKQALKLATAARTDFAELDPPNEGKAVHRALLDALDASLATAEKALASADAGDFEEMSSLLDDAADAGNRSDAAAKEFGFDECGTSSSPGA